MSSSPASDLLGADVVRELEPPKGGLAVVPDLPHAGFYAVAWPGPQAGSRVVPANFTSVAESDLNAKRKTA